MNGVIQHHVPTDPILPQQGLFASLPPPSEVPDDARWYVEPIGATDGIEGATTHWVFDPISWHVEDGPV